LHLAAALVTLVVTVLVVGSRTWVCSSTETGSDPSCGMLTVADVIVDVVLVLIGLGATAFFMAKAVRSGPRH